MRALLLCSLLAACGGGDDAPSADAGPTPDAAGPDATDTGSFISVSGQRLPVYGVTAAYSADDNTIHVTGTTSSAGHCAAGGDTCYDVIVLLPMDAAAGHHACSETGYTVLLQRQDNTFFQASPGTAGSACELDLDAIGAVGQPIDLSGLSGALVDLASAGNGLTLDGGELHAVRAADQ